MTTPLAWRPAEFKPGEVNKTERLIMYSLSTREGDRDGEVNQSCTHSAQGRRTGTERLIVYSLSTREGESEEADRDREVNNNNNDK